jgi:hypothetical protein
MATVHGGLFHASAPAHVAAAARPDAGHLSLASVTGGYDTTVGSAGDPRFAGGLPASTEQVVATQTQVGGNTVVSLNDGSTITFVGVIHVDAIIH